MDYIMITLKRPGQNDLDLKIPCHITGKDFLIMLQEITNTDISPESKIQAEPLGRILDNDQTLYTEGVGNGALLTIL